MFSNYVGRLLLPMSVALVYLFLYLPIFVLVIFSFNSVAFPYKWVSFSFQWYYELFQSAEIWEVLKNSLIVATVSVALSLIMGMLLIFYASQYLGRGKMHRVITLFYGHLMIPEIVLAVGLLSLFTFLNVPLGLTTLIAGHTIIGLGYVVPILYTRFMEIDYSVIEASLDLGASLHQTFLKIIVPIIMPTMIAVGLLIFVISFDDFLLSFFCTGTTAQTLSLYIFTMIRTGVSPTINALSTLLLLFSSILVLVVSFLQAHTRIF